MSDLYLELVIHTVLLPLSGKFVNFVARVNDLGRSTQETVVTVSFSSRGRRRLLRYDFDLHRELWRHLRQRLECIADKHLLQLFLGSLL